MCCTLFVLTLIASKFNLGFFNLFISFSINFTGKAFFIRSSFILINSSSCNSWDTNLLFLSNKYLVFLPWFWRTRLVVHHDIGVWRFLVNRSKELVFFYCGKATGNHRIKLKESQKTNELTVFSPSGKLFRWYIQLSSFWYIQ